MGPTGRAQGIPWVEEFLTRVEGHCVDTPAKLHGANMTLDTNTITFRLNQSSI